MAKSLLTCDMKKMMSLLGLVSVVGTVVETRPRPSNPVPPDQTSDGDTQAAVAGTPAPEATAEEVDVELGEGGRMSQHAPSTTSSAASVTDAGGGATSRRKKVEQNLLIGLALLSQPCTGLFTANPLPFALYMGLTSLGLLVSVFLSYAGDGMPENLQKALLAVSTMALLGALAMLGVGASLQAGFF